MLPLGLLQAATTGTLLPAPLVLCPAVLTHCAFQKCHPNLVTVLSVKRALKHLSCDVVAVHKL